MTEAGDFGDWDALAKRVRRFALKSGMLKRQLERSALLAREVAAAPESWRRLQPIVKSDLIEDQDLDPPFGSRLCVPLSEIGLIVESSGSSGRGQETHYLSYRDFDRLRRVNAFYLQKMGIGATDIGAVTFPLGMAGGGIKLAEGLSTAGAKVLRMASLSATEKIARMLKYGVTLLVATPSYVDRLEQVCLEIGRRPSDLGVRRILVATQSVTLEWVARVEDCWKARLFEWYGTSAGLAAFCCGNGMATRNGDRGTLHWDPGFAFQEVVRAETGEWVEDGQRGELVGTTLQCDAEPIFRLKSGDEVRFRAPGSCSCGSSHPGIESGTVRRLDDMYKVKGVNVWPAQVEATLFDFESIRDYRVELTQDASKRERIRLEVLAASDHPPTLPEELTQRLRDRTGLSFDISVVSEASVWTQATEGEAAKTRRWVDARGRK